MVDQPKSSTLTVVKLGQVRADLEAYENERTAQEPSSSLVTGLGEALSSLGNWLTGASAAQESNFGRPKAVVQSRRSSSPVSSFVGSSSSSSMTSSVHHTNSLNASHIENTPALSNLAQTLHLNEVKLDSKTQEAIHSFRESSKALSSLLDQALDGSTEAADSLVRYALDWLQLQLSNQSFSKQYKEQIQRIINESNQRTRDLKAAQAQFEKSEDYILGKKMTLLIQGDSTVADQFAKTHLQWITDKLQQPDFYPKYKSYILALLKEAKLRMLVTKISSIKSTDFDEPLYNGTHLQLLNTLMVEVEGCAKESRMHLIRPLIIRFTPFLVAQINHYEERGAWNVLYWLSYYRPEECEQALSVVSGKILREIIDTALAELTSNPHKRQYSTQQFLYLVTHFNLEAVRILGVHSKQYKPLIDYLIWSRQQGTEEWKNYYSKANHSTYSYVKKAIHELNIVLSQTDKRLQGT